MSIQKVFLLFSISLATITNSVHKQYIMVNSIPKCGSHLLYKCLYLMTGKVQQGWVKTKSWSENVRQMNIETHFGATHSAPIEQIISNIEQHNAKMLVALRDPRDQIVSGANFFTQHLEGFGYLSFKKRIDELMNRSVFWIGRFITGIRDEMENGNIADLYRRMLEWDNYSFVYIVKFEKLIGKKGNGSRADSIDEIMNIAHPIGYPLSITKAKQIADTLFGTVENNYSERPGLTAMINFSFNKGKVGQWKKAFTKKQKERFKEIAGDLLIEMGYEKDYNW